MLTHTLSELYLNDLTENILEKLCQYSHVWCEPFSHSKHREILQNS